MSRGMTRAVVLGAAGLLWAVPGASQGVDPQEESRLLREASSLEWRGRVQEAESVLVRLLTENPTSTGGVFALERILRNQSRLAEILPWADRFLVADARASGVRYMKLRVLVEVDSLQALDREARAWYAAEPGSPDPFREVARLYQRALGDEAALGVLREGRERLGDPAALSVEMGDLLARSGDQAAAAGEWARALRDPEADLPGILRRVEGIRGGGNDVVGAPLVAALEDPPVTLERRTAAVRVALLLSTEPTAESTARRGLDALPRVRHREFLQEVGRRAEEHGAHGLALWALREERTLAPERERSALDVRLASLALQAGDTATALEARSRLARSLPAGSVERRRVMADLIRVEAASASRETLAGRLGAFTAEYPDAPEYDDLVAASAAGLAARGQVEAARAILSAGGGPLASLEGGYLHFQMGEVEAGVTELESALPALAPSRATEVLGLLSFLQRLGPAGAEMLVRSAARAHHGDPYGGVEGLVESLGGVPDADRAPLMAWAGETSVSAGDGERAEELYQALVDGYPAAPEYPEAALALARLQVARGETDAAREVLERLILDRPESPVVPAARRELQRLRAGRAVGTAGGPR